VARDISLLQNILVGSGIHPAIHPVGTEYSFHGTKWLGRESDYCTPNNAEIKIEWSYIFTSPYVLIACKKTILTLTLSTSICTASILLSVSSVAFWFFD
jgi:hypothetical protein